MSERERGASGGEVVKYDRGVSGQQITKHGFTYHKRLEAQINIHASKLANPSRGTSLAEPRQRIKIECIEYFEKPTVLGIYVSDLEGVR